MLDLHQESQETDEPMLLKDPKNLEDPTLLPSVRMLFNDNHAMRNMLRLMLTQIRHDRSKGAQFLRNFFRNLFQLEISDAEQHLVCELRADDFDVVIAQANAAKYHNMVERPRFAAENNSDDSEEERKKQGAQFDQEEMTNDIQLKPHENLSERSSDFMPYYKPEYMLFYGTHHYYTCMRQIYTLYERLKQMKLMLDKKTENDT